MDDPHADGPVPASRYTVFTVIAAFGLALDLVTKEWLFAWPGQQTGRVWWVWEPYAGFQTVLNPGALFGIGDGQVVWFAAISVVAAIAIPLWLFAWRAGHDWWLVLPLGGILGGILGNLYDRLGLHGEAWGPHHARAGEQAYAVRDWILLQASDAWRWPNFNLADSFLVIGAAVMLLRACLESRSDAEAETDSAPAPS